MAKCSIEDKNGYYQIVDFDVETEDLNNIYSKIEGVLKAKKQDMVLSLAEVNALYSSHLALLVRVHQIMQKNNLRFAISDISQEVKNLLQITQLDSIFLIYDTLNDFENSLEPKNT